MGDLKTEKLPPPPKRKSDSVIWYWLSLVFTQNYTFDSDKHQVLMWQIANEEIPVYMIN